MLPPELVFLAIQAGVRLYTGLRTAYIASVREATLTLPLPRAPRKDVAVMVDWFISEAPNHQIVPPPALAAIIAKGRANPASVVGAERAELDRAYNACWNDANLLISAIDGRELPQSVSPISGADYLALAEVRQWAKGQLGAPPTGFQRVAGTLVEVAVFWFANQPGAISDKHPIGRALLSFLKGIENVEFSSAAPPEILDQVLVGVLETVAADPRLVAGGRREEALVRNVAKSVASALNVRFRKKRTQGEELDAASWAQFVARGMLKAGANTVLADPKLFFGTDGDESAIVTEVGTAFVHLLVPDDPHDGNQIALKSLVSATGLETLIRAALKSVGEHPGMLGLDHDRKGVTALIADLAITFSKADVPSSAAAAFPEIAVLVLAKSAQHLDEIWGGGDRKDVARNLLVLAVRRTMEVLAEAAGGNRETMFAKQQMIGLFDAVLAEVAENPRWVVQKIDGVEESKVLTAVLEATLTALRGQKFSVLSGETRLGILKAALKAGGVQLAFTKEIPPGGRDAGKIAIEAVIDAVFAELTHGEATAIWRAGRGSALVALFEKAMDTLSWIPAADPKIQARVDILRSVVRRYAQGDVTIEQFGDLLATQLKTVG